MQLAGFADSSFSLTPFGAGTPISLAAPPANPPEQAAFIDPVTKDYVIDDEGEFERMPEVRQQMLLAVTTALGSSSAEPGKGIIMPKKITDDLNRQARAAVIIACRHITDAGRARINSVTAEQTSLGRVRVTIAYDDLTLGESGTLVV